MHKYYKNKAISTITVLFLTVSGVAQETKSFGECKNEKDALNMMIASQVYANKLMASYNEKKRMYKEAYNAYQTQKLKDSKFEKKLEKLRLQRDKASALWANYSQEISKVGRITHQKEYQKACDRYVALSKQYGGDIKKDYQTTIRVGKSTGTTCDIAKASVVLNVFMQEMQKIGKTSEKEVEALTESAGLDMIQNPPKVCKKVEVVSKKMGISYKRVLLQAESILEKNEKKMKEIESVKKSNAHLNKQCSEKDITTLMYKREDLSNKFVKLEEKWKERLEEARNSKLQNSKLQKLLRAKKKEIYEINIKMIKEFDKKVLADADKFGKYDLACKNYKNIESKYETLLSQKQKEFDTFDAQQAVKNINTTPKVNSSNNEIEKYNNIIEIINHVTPRMQASFAGYVKECGSDKNKRVHQKVEDAVKTFGEQNRKMYERTYGYTITHSFTQDYMQKLDNFCDFILANKSHPEADKVIKEYKKSSAKYMKLYNEIAQYYNMKDYMEDDFKKGDKLHKPIVESFEKIYALDGELRKVIEAIANKKSLEQIEYYKKSNQMVFYHVAKAQFVSKKLFEFASHKKDYMSLDPKKLKAEVDKVRNFYKVFKKYELEHKSVFDDNTDYRYYLDKFEELVTVSREFYARVKNQEEDDIDPEILESLPPQARAMMISSMEGTLSKLLKTYNELVDNYNKLNM